MKDAVTVFVMASFLLGKEGIGEFQQCRLPVFRVGVFFLAEAARPAHGRAVYEMAISRIDINHRAVSAGDAFFRIVGAQAAFDGRLFSLGHDLSPWSEKKALPLQKPH